MAGKGISIEFVSDVRRFLSGTKDISGALEDVSDALDDVAKDAGKAGEEVGSELESGAKEAEDAGKRMERKFRDVLDDVGGSSRKAGDELGDNVKRGTDKAERGLDDVKGEAKQTATEMASSFDGSMDSAVGAVQELSANLGGLGPVGAGAGLAIAGAAGAMFAAWQERTEAMKALVSSMYADMLASGEEFLSESFIQSEVEKIVTGADDAAASWDVVRRGATAAGVDIGLALRAVSGDGEAAAEVMEAVKRRAEELGEGANSSHVDLNGLAGAIEHTGSAAVDTAERVDAGRSAMRTSGEAAREYDQAVAGLGTTLAAATTAIEANNETLAEGEARAAANRGVLSELGDELTGVRDAAVAAGVSGQELNRVQADNYAAFMAAAKAAGLAEDEARELARRYELIPDNVTTTVTTPGLADAIRNATTLRDIMALTPDYKAIAFTTAKVGARASGGPVEGGQSYLVGEHGPEVVTMGRGGNVTPNVNAGGAVRLDDSSIRALAKAIGRAVLAGASEVSRGAVADHSRAVRLAGRPN